MMFVVGGLSAAIFAGVLIALWVIPVEVPPDAPVEVPTRQPVEVRLNVSARQYRRAERAHTTARTELHTVVGEALAEGVPARQVAAMSGLSPTTVRRLGQRGAVWAIQVAQTPGREGREEWEGTA